MSNKHSPMIVDMLLSSNNYSTSNKVSNDPQAGQCANDPQYWKSKYHCGRRGLSCWGDTKEECEGGKPSEEARNFSHASGANGICGDANNKGYPCYPPYPEKDEKGDPFCVNVYGQCLKVNNPNCCKWIPNPCPETNPNCWSCGSNKDGSNECTYSSTIPGKFKSRKACETGNDLSKNPCAIKCAPKDPFCYSCPSCQWSEKEQGGWPSEALCKSNGNCSTDSCQGCTTMGTIISNQSGSFQDWSLKYF